jgi:hypothetical protein
MAELPLDGYLNDEQVTAASTLDPTKCRAKLLSRRGARARFPTLLTLETFDTYGNRVAWGGAAVGCKMWPVDVASATAVPVLGAELVQDHLDGTSSLATPGSGRANRPYPNPIDVRCTCPIDVRCTCLNICSSVPPWWKRSEVRWFAQPCERLGHP